MTNLRAFFCCALVLCSLPLYLSEYGALRAAASGMDAPPPPTLESGHRLGASGSFERRLLGGPSVTNSLWVPGRAWMFTPLRPASPDAAPVRLAELQQWRLEGG